MVLVFLHPTGVHGKGEGRAGCRAPRGQLAAFARGELQASLTRRASSSSTWSTTSHWSTTTPTCTRGGAKPWAGPSRFPPCCVCPSTSWAASSGPRGPWLRSVLRALLHPCPPPSWVQTGPPGCLSHQLPGEVTRACTLDGGEKWALQGLRSCRQETCPQPLFTATQPSTGFPGGSDSKAFACHMGDLGWIPGSGRSPWRRKWQPTPVPLPGKIPWTEEPGGQQSMGCSQLSDFTHSQPSPEPSFPSAGVQPGQRPQEGWPGAPCWWQVAGSGQRPRVSRVPSPGTQGAPLLSHSAGST